MKRIVNFMIMILKMLWKAVERFTDWELKTLDKLSKLPVNWKRIFIIILVIFFLILIITLDGPLCVPGKYC